MFTLSSTLWRRFWLATAVLLLVVLHEPPVAATETEKAAPDAIVTAADGPGGLAAALAAVRSGDTILVRGGVYDGPITIGRPVILIGEEWPVVDGGGHGSVIRITAPDVTISGLVVRRSGDSLDEENTGIAVEAPRATLRGNRLEETLFGIYLRQASGTIISDNVIQSKDVDIPRRGDAVRVWYSDDVRLENNVVDKGRDVVLWYSARLTVRGNQVSNGRYGLHFMYCDDALIEGNQLLNNSVGAFLMYSRRMQLRQNTIAANRGPSGYGVGLKDMDDATVVDNLFLDNRVGAYLDNSPREVDSVGHFSGNVFAYNDIGVDLLPSVRRNQFLSNSFVENQQQVGIAGGGGRGDNLWRENYWSDYAGYDADRDGRGDIPYRAERLFENMMDRQPALRLFVHSPAASAIDFAARAFPIVRPEPKLTDEAPRMAPVIPAGGPALPAPEHGAWPWGATALLLLAAGLAASPAWRGRSSRPASDPVGVTTFGEEPMIIEVANLTKRFGGLTAVDGLSFAVARGEAIALWGANGAGKTTALRCLLNLIPYEGQITIAGHNAARDSKAVRRMIGFVPQELTFHDDLTVAETLELYARLKKVPAGFDFNPLLGRLALATHVDKRVRDLSGGLKQRLALAIALLGDPPVLILDEPTSNLDVNAREEFLALLLDLKRAGKTMIFSSHRLEEMVLLADRVLVLADGRLAADGPPAELGHWLTEPAFRPPASNGHGPAVLDKRPLPGTRLPIS